MFLEEPAIAPNQAQPASTWYQHFFRALRPSAGSEKACDALTRQLLAHYLGYTTTKHILNSSLQASAAKLEQLYAALGRLQKQEPIQYVLRSASFAGHSFKVTPDVFIPRGETEELVCYIIEQRHPSNLQILDLCTGSGCVAISLKKAYQDATVWGVDIDPRALAIARENAKKLNAPVNWLLLDLLHDPLPARTWDLMVSNPPYVPMSEKDALPVCVLEYEPHQAFFVPDHDPIIFYKRIAQLSEHHLSPQGWLYLEVNERLAKQVACLFTSVGFRQVHLHQDLHGKDRWVACKQ